MAIPHPFIEPAMKQLLFVLLVLTQVIKGYSQLNEFTVYPNGLIYSDTAMTRLKHIVDSLNLKYRHCDLYKKYYSLPQGIGYYVTVKKGDARPAFAAMLKNISLEDFTKQYPSACIDSNLLLTEMHETNYKGQTMDAYEVLRNNGRTERCTAPGKGRAPVEKTNDLIWGRKGKWVIDYYPGTYDSSKELKAIYIKQEPVTRLIPDTYAKLILYSDCMVDTTSDTFFKNARDDTFDFEYPEKKKPDAISRFLNYIDHKSKHVLLKWQQDTTGKDVWQYNDSVTQQFIRDSLSITPAFKRLLSTAVQQTLQLKLPTGGLFEMYTEEYYSKSAALAMKRNRRVFGACSRDELPRFHVMDIALLAAETANWQVFLRAHLDIMNDRLDRMANSNFAQAKRKTYIKEIEELDINIQDLMLGISFQLSNPSGNHYFGDIGRLGRAFSETKDSSSLEVKILSAIEDKQLDDYNRLLMHGLFLNYTYYLSQKDHRMACLEKLENADKSMPSYLLPNLIIYKEAFENGPDANRD